MIDKNSEPHPNPSVVSRFVCLQVEQFEKIPLRLVQIRAPLYTYTNIPLTRPVIMKSNERHISFLIAVNCP